MARKVKRNSYLLLDAFFSKELSASKFDKVRRIICKYANFDYFHSENNHIEQTGVDKIGSFPISIALMPTNCVILAKHKYSASLTKYKEALRSIDKDVRISSINLFM